MFTSESCTGGPSPSHSPSEAIGQVYSHPPEQVFRLTTTTIPLPASADHFHLHFLSLNTSGTPCHHNLRPKKEWYQLYHGMLPDGCRAIDPD